MIVIFSRYLYLKLNTLQTLHCSSTASHNEVNTLSYSSVSYCMGMKLTNLQEQLVRAFHGIFVKIYTFHFGNAIFYELGLLTPLSYTICNYSWWWMHINEMKMITRLCIRVARRFQQKYWAYSMKTWRKKST